MNTDKRRMTPIAIWTLALALVGIAATAEKMTVPLSDPERPATVKVSLVAGSIRVEAYPGKEVIVESSAGDRDEDADTPPRIGQAVGEAVRGVLAGESGDDRDREAKAKGMKRIPNRSAGLTVEEEHNQVRVEAESWRHPVDLRIKVPAATALKLATVNDGDIEVIGVAGELEIQNTNGSITVKDAAGTVVANTVNGDIKATLTRLGTHAMAFSSFNGDVDVTLPANLSADLRLSSDNGEIYSDFDVQLESKPSAVTEDTKGARRRMAVEKEMRGRIGAGGPEILFKTFNGDIYIRKAK